MKLSLALFLGLIEAHGKPHIFAREEPTNRAFNLTQLGNKTFVFREEELVVVVKVASYNALHKQSFVLYR